MLPRGILLSTYCMVPFVLLPNVIINQHEQMSPRGILLSTNCTQHEKKDRKLIFLSLLPPTHAQEGLQDIISKTWHSLQDFIKSLTRWTSLPKLSYLARYNTSNGTELVVTTPDPLGPPQVWTVEATAGAFTIRYVLPPQPVATITSVVNDQAIVVSAQNPNDPTQLWDIQSRGPGGVCSINSIAYPGKVWSLGNDRTSVNESDATGSPNQVWIFVPG